MDRRFDFVFGLGSACLCSESLRQAGLQFASYPFDWVSGGDIRSRTDMVVGDFEGWLERDDFEYVGNPEAFGHDSYFNRRTGLLHPHDFAIGRPMAESYEDVRRKYDRRVSRLMERIRASRTVLVAWFVDPQDPRDVPEADIRYCIDGLSRKFPGVKFSLICLDYVKGLPLGARPDLRGDDFVKVACDYKSQSKDAKPFEIDMAPIQAVLSAYSAVDYRTASERRSHRKAERMREYGRFAAKGFLDYALTRMQFKVWKHLKKRLERRGMRLDGLSGGGMR